MCQKYETGLFAGNSCFAIYVGNFLFLALILVFVQWGVREHTSDDHQTSNLCMSELKNCLDNSLGPAFVTFLGDKYGYQTFLIYFSVVSRIFFDCW